MAFKATMPATYKGKPVSFLVSNSTSKHLRNILDEIKALVNYGRVFLVPIFKMFLVHVIAAAIPAMGQVSLVIAVDSGNVGRARNHLPKVSGAWGCIF